MKPEDMLDRYIAAAKSESEWTVPQTSQTRGCASGPRRPLTRRPTSKSTGFAPTPQRRHPRHSLRSKDCGGSTSSGASASSHGGFSAVRDMCGIRPRSDASFSDIAAW
jgi:hypothetical protein